jgi:hypothetical protein
VRDAKEAPPRVDDVPLKQAVAKMKTVPQKPADVIRLSQDSPPSRMLKDSFSPRLLKRGQMQGGERSEARGVLAPYVAASRE